MYLNVEISVSYIDGSVSKMVMQFRDFNEFQSYCTTLDTHPHVLHYYYTQIS